MDILIYGFLLIYGVLFMFQEAQICETGDAAEVRESTLGVHACFFIKSLSLREEHIRDVSVNLLSQLKERFPQVKYIGISF